MVCLGGISPVARSGAAVAGLRSTVRVTPWVEMGTNSCHSVTLAAKMMNCLRVGPDRANTSRGDVVQLVAVHCLAHRFGLHHAVPYQLPEDGRGDRRRVDVEEPPCGAAGVGE